MFKKQIGVEEWAGKLFILSLNIDFLKDPICSYDDVVKEMTFFHTPEKSEDWMLAGRDNQV